MGIYHYLVCERDKTYVELGKGPFCELHWGVHSYRSDKQVGDLLDVWRETEASVRQRDLADIWLPDDAAWTQLVSAGIQSYAVACDWHIRMWHDAAAFPIELLDDDDGEYTCVGNRYDWVNGLFDGEVVDAMANAGVRAITLARGGKS